MAAFLPQVGFAVSLRKSSLPWERALPGWAAVLLGLMASVPLWPGLGNFPGLHADEAWVGLRAFALRQGGTPSWFGMKLHAGPLHQFFVALGFGVAEPTVPALRAVGVCSNTLALMLYAYVTGQLLGRRTAVLATLLLASAPFFAVSGRTATEHAALGPLLALLAVLCLLRARKPSRLKTAQDPLVVARPADNQTQRRFALAAGALLGLGTWNHLVFVALPLSLLSLALVRLRLSLWRRPAVLWASFAWLCVEAGPLTYIGSHLKAPDGSAGVLRRLTDLPQVLLHVWQGDVVALRVAGQVLHAGGPWLGAAALAAAVGLLAAALDVGGRAEKARLTLGLLLLLTVWTAVVAPHCAERLLLLPLWIVPWALCEGMTGLFQWRWPSPSLPRKQRRIGKGVARLPLGLTESWQAGVGRSAATLLCVAVAGLQACLSYGNLYAPVQSGNVRAASFAVGQLQETSLHALDTRHLYAYLLAHNVGAIQTHHFIAQPLRFYDLRQARLQVAELPCPAAEAAATLATMPAATLLTYAHEWPALAASLRLARLQAAQIDAPPQVQSLPPEDAFALVYLPRAPSISTQDSQAPH